MITTGTSSLQTIAGTGLRFEARFASGFVTTFDSGEGAVEPNPMEHRLGAVAA